MTRRRALKERYVTTHGYVMIYRPSHPNADGRGYIYEHRLVAEQMLGRYLEPGEEPHHINQIRTDNRPENIEVMASRAQHQLRHRKANSKLRKPDEANLLIPCACGCGSVMRQYDTNGRPRAYIRGHNARRKP